MARRALVCNTAQPHVPQPRGVGGRFRREGTYVYLQLIHVVVWQKPGGGNGTHSSILAWKISGTEEGGGLQSMGLQRVGHD